jgi:hypothetical protein
MHEIVLDTRGRVADVHTESIVVRFTAAPYVERACRENDILVNDRTKM